MHCLLDAAHTIVRLPCPVVELTSTYAGAYAGRLLAEAGLPVLSIETSSSPMLQRLGPPGPDGFSVPYLSGHAKKARVRVDGESAAGRALLDRLVAASHVVLTDVDPAKARQSPRITCILTSPVDRAAIRYELPTDDVLVQALSGGAAMTGRIGGPATPIGFPIGDLAPAVYAAIGVLHGLIGEAPQKLTVDSLDATVALLSYLGCAFMAFGEDVGFIGSGHPHVVPYGAFTASDGYVVIGAFTQPFWVKLCHVLGRPDLIDDPRSRTFVDRRDNRDHVNQLLNDALRGDTVAHWVERFDAADVPNAPVLSMRRALDQEAVAARDMITSVGPFRLLNSPVVTVDSDASGHRPDLVRDPKQVLREFGLTATEIADLYARGTVRSVFAADED